MALAWRSEAAHDHSRVLAQCFAGADHGPGAAAFTALSQSPLPAAQAADVKTIVVAGATGQTGRRCLERLAKTSGVAELWWDSWEALFKAGENPGNAEAGAALLEEVVGGDGSLHPAADPEGVAAPGVAPPDVAPPTR